MKHFKKTLLVALGITGACGAIFALSLAQSGVLSEARSLEKWEREAAKLDFPTSSKALVAKFPDTRNDGIVIAQKIVRRFEKHSARNKLYTPAATPPNTQTKTPTEFQSGWTLLEPALLDLQKLEEASQWFGIHKDDKPNYSSQDILRERDAHWLGAIAGNLANLGDIQNACRVWHLRNLLCHAQGQRIWATSHFVALRRNLEHIKELEAFAKHWQNEPAFRKVVEETFENANQKFDFRRAAWADALLLQEGLEEYRASLSELREEYVRNLYTCSKEPYRSATQATNLRGYLEPYKEFARTPNSPKAFSDYIDKVRRSHATANKFSAAVLSDLGPIPGIGNRIATVQRDTNLRRKNFSWLK